MTDQSTAPDPQADYEADRAERRQAAWERAAERAQRRRATPNAYPITSTTEEHSAPAIASAEEEAVDVVPEVADVSYLLELEAEPEVLTVHDVDELARIVLAHLEAGALSNAGMVELGLGTLEEVGYGDPPEIAYNRTGLAVVRRLAELTGLLGGA